jgi:uncharacterized protein YbjT (DUF2867 family)
MSVLVVGAAGNIGRRVVAALLDLDVEVTALVRESEREAPAGLTLTGPQVRIAHGDLARPGTLRKAADGCSAVFVLTPHSPHQVELQNAAVDAAAEAGAKVVKLSSWGPAVHGNSPVPGARRHWLTQQYIIRRQVPYTILCPNYFMHVLESRYSGDVRSRGVLPSPAGDRGISMVDARDVAEVAARVLTEDGHDGRTYTLTGPTAPTYSDIANLLTTLTGHTVTYHDLPDDEFATWMESQHRQEWETDHAAAIFRLYREGKGELITADIERVTGHPPRNLRDYLTEVRHCFMPDHHAG